VKIFSRRFYEKIVEGILFLCSTVTTFTVLLIIVFLFKEGLGLFSEKPVEAGVVIATNPDNPVTNLSAAQIKNIFDQKITHWDELGGNKDSILIFSIDYVSNYFADDELGENFVNLPHKIDSLVSSQKGIIAIINKKYLPHDFHGKYLQIADVSVWSFLTGREWFPTAKPAAQLGILPLIIGTLMVSILAIIIALPVGLATAIYMAEVADARIRNILKPVIELLAGIPSVVYGFFGLVVIVPFIRSLFNLPVGETAFAGSIILAIMALPTIITISEDAIRNTPRAVKEASLALGANHWQTIVRVIIPYSISGITAGAILGIGRAIGETMAVLMVTGNAAVIPHSVLQPVRTIPATIAAELGEASQGGIHYEALFALGIILFIITLIINFIVEYVSSKRKFN
jgi:phosphate transport system permease protein